MNQFRGKAWALIARAGDVAHSVRNHLVMPKLRRAEQPGRGRRRAAVALLAARAFVLVVSLMASLAVPMAAGTASASTNPTISTDQADYPPVSLLRKWMEFVKRA